MPLPIRMAAEFPAQLFATPIEDIDPFYSDKKVRVSTRAFALSWPIGGTLCIDIHCVETANFGSIQDYRMVHLVENHVWILMSSVIY